MIYPGPIPPPARLAHDLRLAFALVQWACDEGFSGCLIHDLWTCCESHLFAPPEVW